jgi:hypothetical protein
VTNNNFLQRHQGLHLFNAQKMHNKELDDHLKDCGTESYIEKASEPASQLKSPTKAAPGTPKARNNNVIPITDSQQIDKYCSPEKQVKPRVERICPFCQSHFTHTGQVEYQMHVRNCDIEHAKMEKRGKKRPSPTKNTPKKKIRKSNGDDDSPKSKVWLIIALT